MKNNDRGGQSFFGCGAISLGWPTASTGLFAQSKENQYL
jgi:hypothetical protein